MITHIVMFRLADRSPDSIEKACAKLHSLNDRVPQLRHLEVGSNLVESDRAFDIALISRFDSLVDLEAYQVHPYHVEVATYMRSIMVASALVDYENR